MGQPNGAEPLDEDGLNPRRALILQGYYALRRQRPANTIGTREIADWIKANEPEEDAPSACSTQPAISATSVALPLSCIR